MDTISKRIKAAMLAAGIRTTEEIAKRVEVTPQQVRTWLRSDAPKMSAENLLSLAEVLRVRVLWLGRGIGPIHSFVAYEYSEAELIQAFRTLGNKEKVLVRDFIGLLMRYLDG